LLRVRLPEIAREWDIVVNPRRSVLDASPEELQREVSRLVHQCARP
jgi:RNase P protein component